MPIRLAGPICAAALLALAACAGSTVGPDARADALNWDLLNDGIGNPKNTRSMLHSHRLPPVMITGIRAKAEDAVDLLPASVGTTPEKFALTAAGVAAFAYLLGNLCCFFLRDD